MVTNVRGVAAGCPGSGFGPVCNGQLVDRLHAHTRLQTPSGPEVTVRVVPVLHRGVCFLPAVQCRGHPRDSWSLAGGNRELLQDGPHLHHQTQSVLGADHLKLPALLKQ